MEYPVVSVVIPTHNRKEKLLRLIKSILESDYLKEKLEIIVVDDASTDGTHEYMNKLFPQVKIIRNEEEKLLAESRNIGIRASKGKYILLIDDDNLVDKNAIRVLVEFMEAHPEVGVAGPIMYFLADPRRIWCAGVKRNYWTTLTKFLGFNTIDYSQFKKPYDSEDFPNAFMVRRDIFKKVGLFNSKLFPIHYDEADFCQRVKKLGYRVMVVPMARVWHDIPLPEQTRTSIFHLKNSLRAYYAIRNRILFHAKWSKNTVQRFISLLASLIIAVYYIVMILESNITNKYDVIRSVIKGIIDGLRMLKVITINRIVLGR